MTLVFTPGRHPLERCRAELSCCTTTWISMGAAGPTLLLNVHENFGLWRGSKELRLGQKALCKWKSYGIESRWRMQDLMGLPPTYKCGSYRTRYHFSYCMLRWLNVNIFRRWSSDMIKGITLRIICAFHSKLYYNLRLWQKLFYIVWLTFLFNAANC